MADASLEFSGDQPKQVTKLSLIMKAAAGVLFLLACVNLVGGALTLLTVSPGGLWAIVEGLIFVFLGLILLSSSSDIRFMVQTPYVAIHLGNAFLNLRTFFQALLLLVTFLVFATGIKLFVG